MANLSLLLFNYAQGGRDGAGQSQWLRAKKKKFNGLFLLLIYPHDPELLSQHPQLLSEISAVGFCERSPLSPRDKKTSHQPTQALNEDYS